MPHRLRAYWLVVLVLDLFIVYESAAKAVRVKLTDDVVPSRTICHLYLKRFLLEPLGSYDV
jgi:hypothetical protein